MLLCLFAAPAIRMYIWFLAKKSYLMITIPLKKSQSIKKYENSFLLLASNVLILSPRALEVKGGKAGLSVLEPKCETYAQFFETAHIGTKVLYTVI